MRAYLVNNYTSTSGLSLEGLLGLYRDSAWEFEFFPISSILLFCRSRSPNESSGIFNAKGYSIPSLEVHRARYKTKLKRNKNVKSTL